MLLPPVAGIASASLSSAVSQPSGPADAALPEGVEIVRVETAAEMLAAVEAALPSDAAVFAAAVADWRVAEERSTKMKKDGAQGLSLELTANEGMADVADDARGRLERALAVVADATP